MSEKELDRNKSAEIFVEFLKRYCMNSDKLNIEVDTKSEIDRLTKFIFEEYLEEIQEGESVVDVVIRLLTEVDER